MGRRHNDRTPLGLALVSLRKDYAIGGIAAMASALRMTPGHLSAVERGMKAVPVWLVERLAQSYDLKRPAVKELEHLALLSARKIEIQMSGFSHAQRSLAVEFSRVVPRMGDGVANEALDYLRGVA